MKAFISIVMAVTIAFALVACDSTTVKPTYSEPERYNGYVVLERLNDRDVCLLVDGVPTWITIMPEPKNLEPIVDWDAFDSILGDTVG